MGTTTPTTGLETPRCSILAISRGSAASDDEVEKISRYSRARYFMSEKMFTPVTIFSIRPRITMMNSAQVM